MYPLLTTDEEKEQHVDLLYLKDEKNSHYCLIKNLSRLVGAQKSKHSHSIHLCRRCLSHFGTEDLLKTHRDYCKQHEAVKIIMPKEGETIKFKDFNRSMKVPFVVYADFECMLTPVESNNSDQVKMSYTKSTKNMKLLAFHITL